MIIDSHTHIFPFGFINKDIRDWFKKTYGINDNKFGVDELLREMDKNKIEKSIILPLIKDSDFYEVNNYMSKIQDKYPERFICFGTVNPKDTDSSTKELKRIKNKLRLNGVKLHTALQSFYPNDEKIFKIYEISEELKLPILFHSGFGGLIKLPDKYSEPIYLDDVACRFSELRIIIGHGGRYFYDQTSMLLRKHKNIYTEISTNLPKRTNDEKYKNKLLIELLWKIKIMNGSLGKVFFGSDFPFRTISETINLLNSLKDTKMSDIYISSSEIEDIFERNIIEALGDFLNI